MIKKILAAICSFLPRRRDKKVTEPTLEERVAYLEANIRALNQSAVAIAQAMQALLNANQTKSEALSGALSVALEDICPFPPGC